MSFLYHLSDSACSCFSEKNFLLYFCSPGGSTTLLSTQPLHLCLLSSDGVMIVAQACMQCGAIGKS